MTNEKELYTAPKADVFSIDENASIMVTSSITGNSSTEGLDEEDFQW